MRDKHARASTPLQREHDVSLGHRVQGARRLVKNHNPGIADQGSSDLESLALTSGKLPSTSGQHGIIAARTGRDHLMQLGIHRGPEDLRLGDRVVPHRDVVADGPFKDRDLLIDECKAISNHASIELAPINPVNENVARPRLLQADDDAPDCRLATTTAAHQRHPRTGI